MKRIICMMLALVLCLGVSAAASGEPSGGMSGSALPDELSDLPTVEAEPWVEVSDERVGLEGPAFDGDGNLYVCSTGMNYPVNYILKIDPEKTITTIYEGELSPLGLAFHEDGRLFAVCREGVLLVMEPDGTILESLTPMYDGKTLSLNDLCFTSDGDLFITDWQGSVDDPTGGIYLLTRESGYEDTVVIADRLAGPNGISLSPDEQTLWVGMTNEQAVYRIDLNYADGLPAAESIEKIYENSGSGQPDSNKTDSAGNVYQAVIQAGRILVFNEDGEPIMNVVCPDSSLRMTSNLAIKPGTNEGYMLAAGFGAGSWIYTFETLAPAGGENAVPASAEASGEASGSVGAVSKNISCQHADYAAVTDNAGNITLRPENVDLLDVADGAEVTGDVIEGVFIRADNTAVKEFPAEGEYGAYSVGVSGIAVLNDTVTIGGERGFYDVDYTIGGSDVPKVTEGTRYSNVILLDNEDETEWDESAMRRGENTFGVAISTGGDSSAGEVVTIDNTFAWFDGWVRTALLANYGNDQSGADIVVKNSQFAGLGGESYKYGWMALYGGARSTILQTGGDHYFYNTGIATEGWGAYALEGVPSNVIAVNSRADVYGGGYAMYNPGTQWSEIYGGDFRSAMYGLFLTNDSKAVIGTLYDVDDEGNSLYSGHNIYQYESLKDVEETGLATERGGTFICADFAALLSHNTAMSRNGTAGNDDIAYIHGSTLTTDELTYDFSENNYGVYIQDYAASDDNAGASWFWIDSWRGSTIVNRSSNWTIDVDDSELISRTGVIYYSTPDWEGASKKANFMLDDSVAKANGAVLNLRNMSTEGDIFHNDFFRPMAVNLDNASLSGAVVSGTAGSWNAMWSPDSIRASDAWAVAQEQIASWKQGTVPNSIMEEFSSFADVELDAEKISANLSYDPSDIDKDFDGVTMSIGEGSVWTVTGESSLNQLTVADGAIVQAPSGYELEIFENVSMDVMDESFDTETGSTVAELLPGTYRNVVILVTPAASGEAS